MTPTMLKVLADDGRLKGSNWEKKDYYRILPRERDTRAEVKLLRKSAEGLKEIKKLKRAKIFKLYEVKNGS